jgi:anti-sigma factor RsiW
MIMNCKKVLSRLNAHMDGEMPVKVMREMKEHLEVCSSCNSQLERIRQVGDTLDSLSVPPVPVEFAARIMAEASGRAPLAREKEPFSSRDWQPLRWLLGLSVPMRIAACTALFLACLLGVLMSKEVSLSESRQTRVPEPTSLDGFEWFNPNPPASLVSAYFTLALTTHDDQGAR